MRKNLEYYLEHNTLTYSKNSAVNTGADCGQSSFVHGQYACTGAQCYQATGFNNTVCNPSCYKS